MVSLTEGLAVDAAHSTKNRKTEFQGVDLKTGKTVFRFDLGNQTVNIGEFLAIVEGVKYILETGYEPRRVFSDSVTAISWFKNKRTASGKRNKLLMKAEVYLRAMAYWVDTVEVVKWNNREWGEIPADFGNKQSKHGITGS